MFKEYEHCCSNLTQTQLYTVQCKPIVFETQNIVLSCTILSYIVSAVDLCFNLVVILCKKKKQFELVITIYFYLSTGGFFRYRLHVLLFEFCDRMS